MKISIKIIGKHDYSLLNNKSIKDIKKEIGLFIKDWVMKKTVISNEYTLIMRVLK